MSESYAEHLAACHRVTVERARAHRVIVLCTNEATMGAFPVRGDTLGGPLVTGVRDVAEARRLAADAGVALSIPDAYVAPKRATRTA